MFERLHILKLTLLFTVAFVGSALAQSNATPGPTAPNQADPAAKVESERYVVDLLIWAYPTVDTGAEFWQKGEDRTASVMPLFFRVGRAQRTSSPSLATETNRLTGAEVGATDKDITDEQAFFSPVIISERHALDVTKAVQWRNKHRFVPTRYRTPIDRVVAKVSSLNATPLIRRQWTFDDIHYFEAPRIRLNDFNVWRDRAVVAFDVPTTGSADGAGRVVSDSLGEWLADDRRVTSENEGLDTSIDAALARKDSGSATRCDQDSNRKLIARHTRLARSEPRSARRTTQRQSLKRMLLDGADNAPDSERVDSPPELSEVVELSFTPMAWDYPSDENLGMIELDLNGDKTNRLDGYIKIFRSRFHHAELNLQFLRPFFTDQPSRPDSSSRQYCLLAFFLRENRRLKRGEIHYFDHPAFAAVLYFGKEPVPVEKERSIE